MISVNISVGNRRFSRNSEIPEISGISGISDLNYPVRTQSLWVPSPNNLTKLLWLFHWSYSGFHWSYSEFTDGYWPKKFFAGWADRPVASIHSGLWVKECCRVAFSIIGVLTAQRGYQYCGVSSATDTFEISRLELLMWATARDVRDPSPAVTDPILFSWDLKILYQCRCNLVRKKMILLLIIIIIIIIIRIIIILLLLLLLLFDIIFLKKSLLLNKA